MTISQMPIDLVEHIIGFLDLHSTASLLSTTRSASLSQEWIYKLWKRACATRWKYTPTDRGSGAGLALDLNRADWYRAALCREWIEAQINLNSGAESITAIVTSIGKRMSNDNVIEEGARWIVEIFDQSDEQQMSCIAIDEISLWALASASSRSMDNSSCQHLLVKVFGILALNEGNRRVLPKLGVIKLIVKAMRKHQFNSDLLENALWALVILGRPMGCSEGSRFMTNRMTSICHISDYMSNTVVMTILTTAKRFITKPSVLAKAFWAMVNLALIDTNKQLLVSQRAIHLIIMAMNKYPYEQLLHFRGCFAMINLSLNREARNLICSLNGIETVLASMQRFADFPMLQRCACNMLMSMVWASPINRERMVNLKAGEIIERALALHGSFADLSQVALSLLSML